MRQGVGAPACPRCRRILAPTDQGIDLASLDAPPAIRAMPVTPWVLEADRLELRRIGRRLRPCVRNEAVCTLAPPEQAAFEAPVEDAAEPIATLSAEVAATEAPEAGSDDAGAAAIAADCGFLVLIAGVATMAAQGEGLIDAEFWRWGLAGAGLGAAAFAFGVIRLATRAARQASKLAAEVDALRGEVAELRAKGVRSPAQPRPSLFWAHAASAPRERVVSSRAA